MEQSSGHLFRAGGLNDAEGAAVLRVNVGLRSDGGILLAAEEHKVGCARWGRQRALARCHDLALQPPHLPRPVVYAVHLLACAQESSVRAAEERGVPSSALTMMPQPVLRIDNLTVRWYGHVSFASSILLRDAGTRISYMLG